MIPADPKNILIIKLSSLGDVVHALPALRALRLKFPSARISWLVNRGLEGILEGNPDLDEIIRFDRKRWGQWRDCGAMGELKSFVLGLRDRSFDLVLDLQGLLRSGVLAALTDAPVRVGFTNARELSPLFYTHKVPVPEDDIHAVDRYLLATSFLGANLDDAVFPVAVNHADEVWAEDELGRLGITRPPILVNPSARWITKQWSLDRFAEACRVLSADGYPVVLIGGGEDTERCHRLRELAGLPLTDLSGKTTLKQLVALMRRSSLLLTNDSGPMHLAVATGLAVV
ncbi:MAG: glycosyltransferase family 9 protein, partial [Nitrospirota bacterium]|nr:glycosyltransferase family 9 protein [Nitrospirota bacterium]